MKWKTAKNSLIKSQCNAAVEGRSADIDREIRERTAPTETVDEYLKRGGKIKRLSPR